MDKDLPDDVDPATALLASFDLHATARNSNPVVEDLYDADDVAAQSGSGSLFPVSYSSDGRVRAAASNSSSKGDVEM